MARGASDAAPWVIRPHATWRYATPVSACGHATLTQLPSSRLTSKAFPRGALAITALPVLGALCTSADVIVTTNSVSCAYTGAVPITSITVTAAA
jgi:hypothetical protein